MNRQDQQPLSGSPRLARLGVAAGLTAVLLAASAAITRAEPPGKHPPVQPGGVSPSPVLTNMVRSGQSVKMDWKSFGLQVLPRGTNVVYQISMCPALKGTNTSWTSVAAVTNTTTLSTTTDGEIGFIRIQQDPAPSYAGSEKCGFCHLDTHDTWMTTRHAGALETLKAIKQEKNTSCLPCHTVGFGTPNGYKDEILTPQLGGVQCENCHGPAAGHASAPLDAFNQVDVKKLPVKTLSAQMCGGCHTDAHHPTYDEWASSAHGSLEIPEEEFSDPASGPGRMTTCGACHSAATRLALLNETLRNPDPTNFHPVMPTTQEASESPIACATCHELHAKRHEAQLRFPLHSEMNYSYNTSTNFAKNFNPDVQTCGQCHNMRGAVWTGTSRPPHHSPQYNILIGKGGFEAGETNIIQGGHLHIENQCAQCHTHAHSPDEITEATPNYTGHDFKPTLKGCVPCHDEAGGELLAEAVQEDTKAQIAEIKGLLDQWALTKAPEELKKYNILAWEFTSIGQLSKPVGDIKSGPTSADQAKIPNNIKQARFNLYLIEHDASYGVHNGPYSRFLLQVAREKVKAEL